MSITTRRLAAVTTAATLGLGSLALAGSAHADGIGVSDPRDLSHGVDLRAVVVDHGSDDLTITSSHTKLRRSFRSGSAGAFYLDTDEADKGPEYVLVGGFYEGTDYQFLRTEGFGHRSWGKPVRGTYRMRVNYAKDRVRVTIDRKAIGSPEQVRLAVRVSGTRRDGTSTGLVDWLGEPRSFTEWVSAD